MDNNFHGVYAALLTPFDEKEKVSERRLRGLVRFLISKGLHGLYICGSTGEGINMNVDERKLVAEIVKDEARDKIKIICHIGGSNNTKNAVELAKHAKKLKLDGLSSVPPFYYGYSFNDIFKYYNDVASCTDLPFIIYYIPGTTGVTISNDKMMELAKIKNIIGLKFTGYDFYSMQELLMMTKGRWIAFSGPDEMSLPALTMGVVGSIGSTQNNLPEIFLGIYNSFKSGNIQKAMQLQRRITPAITFTRRFGSLVSRKVCLKFRGVDAGFCKRPLLQKMTKENERKLKEIWKRHFPEYCEGI